MAPDNAPQITNNAAEFCARRFDFLVVGGGTAGLAVAARLAENPALTVGVLEAGTAAVGDDDVDIPGYSGRSLGGELDWQFETTPQPGLRGRKLPWNRGKVLGGSSALNFMTWNRASRDDYDAWEELGNPGWGWDSLLSSESFHPPTLEFVAQHKAFYDASFLGSDGPIHISYTKEFADSHAPWHGSLNALGVETNKSHMSGSNVGVWTNICAVTPETGARSYATHYVSPPPANLFICTAALVQEIILFHVPSEDVPGQFTATGVRFTQHGEEFVASASKEIILSAGSVQSPQILELSGIGNPEVLAAAGIDVKVSNKNVGENLQEHMSKSIPHSFPYPSFADPHAVLAMIYEADPSLPNPADLLTPETAAAAREQFAKDHSGPLCRLPCSMSYLPLSQTIPTAAHASIASAAASLTAYPTSHHDILTRRFAPDSKPLGQVEYVFDLGNWSPFFTPDPSNGKKYATILQILQYPFSRGSIHIAPGDPTKKKPWQPPQINPGYYAGAHGTLDLEAIMHSSRFAHTIASSPSLGHILRGPAHTIPSDDEGEEEALRKWVQDNTITDWHPVGTCAMGGHAGRDGGVVDARLRVYGVRGLRVADASVMPLQISAHLQATVYAIAEKAAAMVLEDWWPLV
ncbi:hypothetical protein B0T22DRAFT_418528 [Podospora appendiculata]|uniref:Glucose-methanol-choline oxidoreductase N-terminal domain-containing protein n=1 Tax=Podospora appendiculata TaxID=314037 RepID=A0AAE0XLN1_9PEZI|nr:hypothetical protein B0T22DRAFT_418528 [Podospora appendiculata]